MLNPINCPPPLNEQDDHWICIIRKFSDNEFKYTLFEKSFRPKRIQWKNIESRRSLSKAILSSDYLHDRITKGSLFSKLSYEFIGISDDIIERLEQGTSKMNPFSVKSVEQCTKEALKGTCDKYDEASSWLDKLNIVFEDLGDVIILGEITRFKKFALINEHIIIAVVRRNKKNAKVTLSSIELLDGSKAQKLWIEAYIKYSKIN